jgi:hypothetical protein
MIEWQAALRKWCEENPPPLPVPRDTSGSMDMSKVDWEGIRAVAEESDLIIIRYEGE